MDQNFLEFLRMILYPVGGCTRKRMRDTMLIRPSYSEMENRVDRYLHHVVWSCMLIQKSFCTEKRRRKQDRAE